MAKTTPGPWTANLDSSHGDYVVWGPRSDSDFVANVGTAPTENGIVAFDVSAANARLIAAAPDLLALLEEARLRCSGWTVYSAIKPLVPRGPDDGLEGWQKRVDAVLAKAER